MMLICAFGWAVNLFPPKEWPIVLWAAPIAVDCHCPVFPGKTTRWSVPDGAGLQIIKTGSIADD